METPSNPKLHVQGDKALDLIVDMNNQLLAFYCCGCFCRFHSDFIGCLCFILYTAVAAILTVSQNELSTIQCGLFTL